MTTDTDAPMRLATSDRVSEQCLQLARLCHAGLSGTDVRPHRWLAEAP
jgi:hypothetical protein